MQSADFTRPDAHRYLKDCAWPCSPSICIQIARDNGAPPALLAHLEAAPNRVYLSESELLDELERAGALAGREQPAMMANQAGVQVGMTVVGSDGDEVGKVKQVGEGEFLLDRRLMRDLYVPLASVSDVHEGQAVLDIPAAQIHYQGWASPPLLGRSSRGRA